MDDRRPIASPIAAILTGVCLCWATTAFANHPVLVEGEQDFDGDGLIGAAEDTDTGPDGEPDQIFGTIGAALDEANRGANQNGHVIIVTSGRFLETVEITADNGDVTLQAAPGVEAEIEAVRAGDAAGNAARQRAPGILIDAPPDVRVTIRNIVSRNWTDGILIQGESHVLLDNVRVEHNRDTNVRVTDSAVVTIVNSQIHAAGFRRGADPVVNTPRPGNGIRFQGSSSGTVAFTTVSGNFAAGIVGRRRAVTLLDGVVLSDNNAGGGN